MTIQCLIFDFDGTLADTEEHTFKIFNLMADKYNYKKMTREDLAHIKHLNFREIIKWVGIPYSKVPGIIKEGQKLMKENIEDIKPFEQDIRKVLLSIHDKVHNIGIITSNTKKNVESFLDKYNIDFFQFIISSPLHSKEKKINSIAKKYSVDKHNILYVGDETRDILACKKSGVMCAAVTWGYNSIEALTRHNPDYIINNLEELMEIIIELDHS